MAKQKGIAIRGTFGNLTYYRLGSGYYMRSKSSLDAMQIKTSKAFKTFRYNSRLLARASSIASCIYQSLSPDHPKGSDYYRMLTGTVMRYLKQGLNRDEILNLVRSACRCP